MLSRQAEIMDRITNMPLLSRSASLLLQLMSDESWDIARIEEIVAADNVLTAKILKVVNSAAFSLSREITSISDAIPYIGARLIQSIAFSSSASDVFGRRLEGYSAGNEDALWAHSLKTAVAAREIAGYSSIEMNRETAFTCGLIHDIGKSVISSYIVSENKMDDIAAEIKDNPNVDFLTLEERFIGMNHSQTGYLISKHWELPEIFQNIVLLHHSPGEAPEQFRHYVYCVHLADIITQMTGQGTGVDSMRYPLNDSYENYFTIDNTVIQKLILVVDDEFKRIRRSFFIDEKSL